MKVIFFRQLYRSYNIQTADMTQQLTNGLMMQQLIVDVHV